MKGPSRLLLWKSAGTSVTASRGSGVAALRSPVAAKMSQSYGERAEDRPVARVRVRVGVRVGVRVRVRVKIGPRRG